MYSPAEILPGHSRVWVYQCNRMLTESEAEAIAAETRSFLETWTAHDQALRAGFEIRHNRFLILMIDEKTAGASGCSIDKSVHFIQSLEKKFGVSFFDRMLFAYKIDGRVEAVSKGEFEKLFAKGILNEDTIVFNNLVQSKDELSTAWEVPIKDSWHRTVISS
jgi:hypothetical protein